MTYSTKLIKHLQKLNGHQIGLFMSLYFKDTAMRDFCYDALVGGIEEDDTYCKERYNEMLQLMKVNNIKPQRSYTLNSRLKQFNK